LTADGEIIKMGETAKAFRKHEEEIEALKKPPMSKRKK